MKADRMQTQQFNDWTKKNYFKRVLIGFDQFINALIGGNPDMTLSGRIGERIRVGRATKFEVYLCRTLSIVFFDKKHCISSIEEDET